MMKKMILTLVLGLGLAQVSAVETDAPKKVSVAKRAMKSLLVGVGAVALVSFAIADNQGVSFFNHPEVKEVKDDSGEVTTKAVEAVEAAKLEWLVNKVKGMPAGFMKLVCPFAIKDKDSKIKPLALMGDILVDAAALIALGDYIIRADKSFASKLANKAKSFFSKKAVVASVDAAK